MTEGRISTLLTININAEIENQRFVGLWLWFRIVSMLCGKQVRFIARTCITKGWNYME
jgi:hypothetical protein